MTEMAGESLTTAAVETSRVVAAWWQVGQVAIARPYLEHPTNFADSMRLLQRLAKSPTSADFSLARRHCLVHAAACCLQIWQTNRDRLAPVAADGEWLVLCLERLAGGSDWAPTSADLKGPICDWMLGQLDRAELFSILPFELAR